MADKKTYRYLISRGGSFMGELDPVTSDFNYNFVINSAAAQLEVVVGKSADVAGLPVDTIDDESGNPLQTEAGDNLTIERQPDIVGDSNSLALIRNDNDIEVIEYSKWHPNGITVYLGYISKWKTRFGGDDNIVITCLTRSQDLGHYLTPGSTPDTLDQSQTTSDGDGLGFWSTRKYGQTFKAGAAAINTSKIKVRHYQMAQTRTYIMKVYNSFAEAQAGATPIGQATNTIPAAGGFPLIEADYVFSPSLPTTPNGNYYYQVEVDSGAISGDSNTWGSLDTNSGNPYTNGAAYSLTGGGPVAPGDVDMWFKTYYKAPSTAKAYTSTDVSDMLDDIMQSYIAAGGSVAEMPLGFNLTNVVTDYTFNLNTILEGIQKVAELGPANWYWYVDPATLTLYYQPAATAAQHRMVKGVHYETLEIEASKEDIANDVFFTGGDDGTGQNVYVEVTDSESINNNRRGLVRLQDPKVKGATGAATAALLSQNYIDQHNAETYITSIKVLDSVYDISTFDMGEMVGFSGNGNFVDNLLLQIVGINRSEDYATLSLGVLRKRDTAKVEEIKRDLSNSLSSNNPDSPS